MKEVDCICGERMVFLNERIKYKTCVNCGTPVYQQDSPESFQKTLGMPRRARMRRGIRLAGFIAVMLAAAAGLIAVGIVRTRTLSEAALEEGRAEAAFLAGDTTTAAEAYRRVLAAYSRWSPRSDATARVRAALRRVSYAEAKKLGEAARLKDGMAEISLEQMAHLAYQSAPDAWQEEFAERFAGRWVIIRGIVQAGERPTHTGTAYTVSYRLFSPGGRPVEIAFDGPFFERYGLKPGDECLIRMVFTEMMWEMPRASREGRWVLWADAGKSSFITDDAELRDTGWKMDANLESLIALQSSLHAVF